MARYQIILAYDGTAFFGFQRQGPARTVQSVFETALRRLGWAERSILAGGRTDAGVHARGQVIAFDLPWKHPLTALQAALNTHLPSDMAVRQVQLARPTFHPRYDALARRYRYCIFIDEVRNPLSERYAWRVWPAPALERLQPAANLLLGTHDFAAFGTPPRTGGSTERTVTQAVWQTTANGELVFSITANAFLYHMVRHLVAVQMALAAGRLDADTLHRLLNVDPHAATPETWGLAPACGLTLEEISYPPGQDD